MYNQVRITRALKTQAQLTLRHLQLLSYAFSSISIIFLVSKHKNNLRKIFLPNCLSFARPFAPYFRRIFNEHDRNSTPLIICVQARIVTRNKDGVQQATRCQRRFVDIAFGSCRQGNSKSTKR